MPVYSGMITNNDLSARIQAINAEITAWVNEDPVNRFAGLLCDDLNHWSSMGITTAAQLDHYLLVCDVFEAVRWITTAAQLDHYLLVCDVFEAVRSTFGYKPNWSILDASSDAVLKDELAHCARVAREDAEREAREAQEHADAVRSAMTPRSFTIGDVVCI